MSDSPDPGALQRTLALELPCLISKFSVPMIEHEEMSSGASGAPAQTSRSATRDYRSFFSLPSTRWILVLLAISGLFTANVIQWSLRYGRLAMDPVADDVNYLIDGFQRINILSTAGFRAFCNSFIQSPPHSPWSTLLASIAFAFFGVHDWAPYLLNGFLVFLLLLVAWDLVDLRNSFSRVAIISVILLLQLTFQAVLEFRPDFALALFTAIFSLLLLKMGCYEFQSGTDIFPSSGTVGRLGQAPGAVGRKPGPQSALADPPWRIAGGGQTPGAIGVSKRRWSEIGNHFYAGLIAGLAFLTKPPFFPHTAVMLCAAILLAEASRRLVRPRRLKLDTVTKTTFAAQFWPETRGTIKRIFAIVAGVALVAGPYFLLNWRHVLDYFLSNTGGGRDAAIWKIPGGFWGALSSRVHGYSLDVTLGAFTGVLGLWVLLGLGFAVARRNRQAVCFTLGGLALAAVSLLVISGGDMVDPHFAYAWTTIFLLVTLYSVAELVKEGRAGFLAAVFFLMSIFVFYKAGPTRNITRVTRDTARNQSMNDVIVREIAARASGDDRGRPPVVFFTFIGQVNAFSQNWLALTGNLHLTFRDLHRSGKLEEQLRGIMSADFVEVADPASVWLARWLPSTPLQSVLLERLRALPDFLELPPVAGTEGKVFLFEKKR